MLGRKESDIAKKFTLKKKKTLTSNMQIFYLCNRILKGKEKDNEKTNEFVYRRSVSACDSCIALRVGQGAHTC